MWDIRILAGDGVTRANEWYVWPSIGTAPTGVRKMAPRRVRIDRCFGSMATSVYDNWSRSIELAPCPGWVDARVYGVGGDRVSPGATTRASNNPALAFTFSRSWQTQQNPPANAAHATRAASGACWTVLLVKDHVKWWDPCLSLNPARRTQTPRISSSSLSWVPIRWLINSRRMARVAPRRVPACSDVPRIWQWRGEAIFEYAPPMSFTPTKEDRDYANCVT